MCSQVEGGMAKISRGFKATGAHRKLTKSTATPEAEGKEECSESICLHLRLFVTQAFASRDNEINH